MKKVLCPICGNVIRFDEKDRSLTCPVCHSLIKIKIQRVEDKLIESNEYGVPSEQLFSEDEIIIAELDKSAPELFPNEGAVIKKAEKKAPPVIGVRKQKTATPVLVHGKGIMLGEDMPGIEKIESLSVPSDVEKEAQPAYRQSVANVEGQSEARKEGILPARADSVSDSELKWVRWEDIECESELIEDDEITEAAEVAKSKKKFRAPADYRLCYVPIYSIVTFISTLLLLYTPFLLINTESELNLNGAKLIGGIVSQAGIISSAVDVYLYFVGAMLAALVVASAFYMIFAFTSFGEYNKRVLKISNIFALIISLLVAAMSVMFGLTLQKLGASNLTMIWSSLFIVVILQLYVLISNLDKLPKYIDTKKVLLSPKSTKRKSYFLLGISMLFIWSLVVGSLVSLIGNIMYNVLYNFDASDPLLLKLSALSLGIFGTAFSELWIGEVAVVSSAADYMIYSYIDYAVFACTVLLIVVYTHYAGKTASIFLEEIKPKGNENVLIDDSLKESNLAKFLKKSSSISFILYAVLLTLELAGYVVLYRGTANTLPAIFNMLSFVIATAIRCYPYAILSREQYMKAYVEYEEMGADIPPMTRKQRNRLEAAPMLIVIVGYALFISLTILY